MLNYINQILRCLSWLHASETKNRSKEQAYSLAMDEDTLAVELFDISQGEESST